MKQPPKRKGRPAILEGATICKDYLDRETKRIMTLFGGGNRSLGIRKAAQLVVQYLSKQEQPHGK